MFTKLAPGQRIAVILAAVVVLGAGGFLLLPYGKGCTTTATAILERTPVVHHEATTETVEGSHMEEDYRGKLAFVPEKRTAGRDAYDSGGELTACAKAAGPRVQYAAVAGLVGLGIAVTVFLTLAPKRRDGDDTAHLPPPPASA